MRIDPGSNNPFCGHMGMWNQSAGEADENNISGEGEQTLYCTYCGASGDC